MEMPDNRKVEVGYCVLDKEHQVVPADLPTWATFFEDIQNRRVAETIVGPYRVSTVFLGINHSFVTGKPLWFETMIFKDDLSDLYCDRYETWNEAVKGHKKAVKLAKKGEPFD